MRACDDCGKGVTPRVGRGRPFTRCEECRVKPRPRNQARSVRESNCRDCGEAFAVERTEQTKLLRGPTRCDVCRAAKLRERAYAWREANPEKWKVVTDRANTKRLADPEHRRSKREAEILRKYGMSVEAFTQLLAAQDGCCAICGVQPPPQDDSKPLPRGTASSRLHVDHCHTSGRVRGLLCSNCNTMIGLAGEDLKVLMAAVEYLEKG